MCWVSKQDREAVCRTDGNRISSPNRQKRVSFTGASFGPIRHKHYRGVDLL
jgi:hypothetical protein